MAIRTEPDDAAGPGVVDREDRAVGEHLWVGGYPETRDPVLPHDAARGSDPGHDASVQLRGEQVAVRERRAGVRVADGPGKSRRTVAGDADLPACRPRGTEEEEAAVLRVRDDDGVAPERIGVGVVRLMQVSGRGAGDARMAVRPDRPSARIRDLRDQVVLLFVHQDGVPAVDPEGVVREIERHRWRRLVGAWVSPDDPSMPIDDEKAVVPSVGDQQQSGERPLVRHGRDARRCITDRPCGGRSGRNRLRACDLGERRRVEPADQELPGTGGSARRVGEWSSERRSGGRRPIGERNLRHRREGGVGRVAAPDDVEHIVLDERHRVTDRRRQVRQDRGPSGGGVEPVDDRALPASGEDSAGDQDIGTARRDRRIPEAHRERADAPEGGAVRRRPDGRLRGHAVPAAEDVHRRADRSRRQIRERGRERTRDLGSPRGQIDRLDGGARLRGAAAEHEERASDHRARAVVEGLREAADRGDPAGRRVQSEDAGRGVPAGVEPAGDVDGAAERDGNRALHGRGEPVAGRDDPELR